MVESNGRAVAAGVGTFLVAELALLAIGKYKFDNVWKLIALTPAAMAAGGAAGYAFRAKPADTAKPEDKVSVVAQQVVQGITVDNITVAQIDRVEQLMLEEARELMAQPGFDMGQLDGQSARITDNERVGLVCFLAREICQPDDAPDEQYVAFKKAFEIAVHRGWMNDPTWNGQEGDARGKLLITLCGHDVITTFIRNGCDPTLADCEGETGFSCLEGDELARAKDAFIEEGRGASVIGWLSSLPIEQRTENLVDTAVFRGREQVIAWFKENGFHDPVDEKGRRTFHRAIEQGNIGLAMVALPSAEEGGVNAKCFGPRKNMTALDWFVRSKIDATYDLNSWEEEEMLAMVEPLICHPDCDMEEVAQIQKLVTSRVASSQMQHMRIETLGRCIDQAVAKREENG